MRKSSSDQDSRLVYISYRDTALCLTAASVLTSYCTFLIVYYIRECDRYSVPLGPYVSMPAFCACDLLESFQRAELATLPPGA